MNEPGAAPRVSVVIPSYNGMPHLPVCLASLRAQSCRDFETVLVDNGSGDETIAFVQHTFPEVRVLALGRNTVFAGAANSGIRAARGEIIVLLNNDTEADPTWLAELVAALDAAPQAGAATSKMLLFDRRDTLHNAGDGYGRDGMPINRGVWQVDAGQFDGDRFVFSACGGAAAYRRSMLDAIGLFDEDLVAYCEDTDLGWRAQLAGYRCAYAARAIVYHKLSATGGGPLASYYVGRNVLWVAAKNLPGALWRKYRWRIVARQIAIARDAAGAWRGDAARARLRGQVAGVLGLPRMLRKRRLIQADRVESDDVIDAMLS